MISESWKNKTAEAFLMWDAVYTIALGIGAVAITPVVFIGNLIGSEFLTYNANKLYYCLYCEFGTTSAVGTTTPEIVFYDESNAAMHRIRNSMAYWDIGVASIRFMAWTVATQDIWFSNLQPAVYNYGRFTGYRLDITP